MYGPKIAEKMLGGGWGKKAHADSYDMESPALVRQRKGK